MISHKSCEEGGTDEEAWQRWNSLPLCTHKLTYPLTTKKSLQISYQAACRDGTERDICPLPEQTKNPAALLVSFRATGRTPTEYDYELIAEGDAIRVDQHEKHVKLDPRKSGLDIVTHRHEVTRLKDSDSDITVSIRPVGKSGGRSHHINFTTHEQARRHAMDLRDSDKMRIETLESNLAHYYKVYYADQRAFYTEEHSGRAARMSDAMQQVLVGIANTEREIVSIALQYVDKLPDEHIKQVKDRFRDVYDSYAEQETLANQLPGLKQLDKGLKSGGARLEFLLYVPDLIKAELQLNASKLVARAWGFTKTLFGL